MNQWMKGTVLIIFNYIGRGAIVFEITFVILMIKYVQYIYIYLYIYILYMYMLISMSMSISSIYQYLYIRG